jgi:SpoVK/Ycf46/Vps4 family AAA+-type ATPase
MSVGGHEVTVSMIAPDVNPEKMRVEPKKIEFVMKTHTAQQAVIAKLQELNDQRATTRKAVLKMVSNWGDWRTRSDLPPRTMASVSLPQEQKDRILNDLKEFLDAEDTYNRLAIPWHRGYMLYGPPGTGKTSLVKALAHEFNLDLWYVSLPDLSSESSLLSLLAAVGPRSILLLEDIDTAKITHDRDGADQGKISMSSLLNTLDGVATPHGLITFMTTNRFDILDPALTRAGRMDLIEELAYPSLETIGDMFDHFFGLRPFWTEGQSVKVSPSRDISTAQIAEVLKRNMKSFEQAELDVHELLFNPAPTVKV